MDVKWGLKTNLEMYLYFSWVDRQFANWISSFFKDKSYIFMGHVPLLSIVVKEQLYIYIYKVDGCVGQKPTNLDSGGANDEK